LMDGDKNEERRRQSKTWIYEKRGIRGAGEGVPLPSKQMAQI
jgi:hypothetical protein